MLLVESPFAGWFFPCKRFIEKVLIWSVFNLLVFLFERCLFLEFPSFSGQFERKIQNLEWGPLDLTLATLAVFTKQLELRMPAHLHQKVLYAGFTYFLFSIFCCKSIDLKAFHAFGLAFCWLPFPWSSYFKRSIWAENPKFRMRPFTFNTCNSCCIYLLNNKNLECRFTWIKRCDTQGLHISFPYFVEKVLVCKLFMLLVESPFAGWFFPLNVLSKKYWFEVFS